MMTSPPRCRRATALAGCLAGALLLGWSTPSVARQADFIPEETKIPEDKKPDPKAKPAKKPAKPKHWFPSLKAAVSIAFAQSQGVVGIPDGMTFALGLQLNAGLMYKHGGHEWINTLLLNETQTKIPNIDPFVKATDQFLLSSVYQYRFQRVRWIGLYAGLRLNSALLPGNLIRTSDTALLITEPDGTTLNDAVAAQKTYRMTSPGMPLLFKQFAGVVTVPVAKKVVRVEAKLGVGAVETWVDDGLRADDKKDTADLYELKRLQDYIQSGVELALSVGGVAFKDILSYAFTAEVMYPFTTSIDTDLRGAELFNTEFRFTLGIKLWKWASLNYSLAVLRIPLIQPDWQVTNNLMLSFTASYTR